MSGDEAARQARSAIEKLGAMIPVLSGYIERDMLREVDKLQREHLAGLVDRGRATLQRKVAEWSRGGVLAGLGTAGSLDKLLDRYANRLRHADYGSSGLFDAVKISKAELGKIYQFDLNLLEKVMAFTSAIEALGAAPDDAQLRALLTEAEQADHDFDRRETVYHDVIQGAH